MKIILVHDGGLLGLGLSDALEKAGFDVSAVLVCRRVPVIDFGASEEGAGWVINALALSGPDVVEEMSGDSREAWMLLHAQLIAQCATLSMGLFQLSSGYVFDGKKQGAYLSTNPTQPISGLGQMQWVWEQQIRSTLKSYLILRTGWHAEYFVRRIQAAASGEELHFSARKMGQAVNRLDLIRVMVAMMQQVSCKPDLYGLYQYAGAESVSQYELAVQIAQLLGEQFSGSIIEGDTAPLEPDNIRLACIKIRNTFGIRQRPWRRGLNDDVEQVFNHPCSGIWHHAAKS